MTERTMVYGSIYTIKHLLTTLSISFQICFFGAIDLRSFWRHRTAHDYSLHRRCIVATRSTTITSNREQRSKAANLLNCSPAVSY